MQFILQTANVVCDAKNCFYPNRVEVRNAQELRDAVRKDHVCAEYQKNYRSISNFIKSNVVVMDCDNDHSESPDNWITPEKLDEMLTTVSYGIAFSRNHMKEKNGRTARPKFHVYFEIEETSDPDHYAAIKAGIHRAYPFFDGNALDAARFIFGADAGECIWHEGWDTIDELVDTEVSSYEGTDDFGSGPITEGSRNNTMSHFAGRVLKRYGDTQKAFDAFMEHSRRCDPPLSKEELKAIWDSALRFYNNKVSCSEGYVSPEKYNEEFNDTLKPEDYSDIGEAKVLVREYGDELKYTDAAGYLRYNGRFWDGNTQASIGAVEEFLDMQLVDAENELRDATKELVDAGVDEAAVRAGGKKLEKSIIENYSPDVGKMVARYLAAKAYLAFVMKCRNYRYIINVHNSAKPMLTTDINEFDANENLFNTPDGIYDLSKGIEGKVPHDADYLITKMANCSPGTEGMDIWKEALNTFFCGNKELIDYVQETVGIAAIGEVYQEALVIAYGEGRNGKSTFWNTIARVMGTYSGTMSTDTLTSNCRRNIMPEIAELKGKRLVIAAELEEGTRLSTAILKKLCSTDLIHAEKKYREPHSFKPTHTVVLYTNHLPKVSAIDEGTWRRLIVIPFQAKIEGNSDIKNYSEYLFKNAGGAIMSWIIEGAKRVIEKKFHIVQPKIVQDAVEEYRDLNDWLSHFIDECCETGNGYEVKSSELYEEYRAFCLRTGEYTRCTADFASTLEKTGYKRKRKTSGMWFQGIRIKDSDFAD